MSSRRRDRSWERDDRDARDRDRDKPSRSSRGGPSYRDEPRRRSSRSRSPRRGDRDRRGSGLNSRKFPSQQAHSSTDRKDHRYDDRRDSDRRRRDERDRDHDHARSRPRKDDERDSPRPRSPGASREPEKPPPERDAPRPGRLSFTATEFRRRFLDSGPSKRLNLDPDAPDDLNEEGEEMDDEAGMMAMMGMSGFGSTKVSALLPSRHATNVRGQGKHIDGNQEGAANVKKQRTWRQYMNRYLLFASTTSILLDHSPTDAVVSTGLYVPYFNLICS